MVSKEDILYFFFVDDIVFAFKKKDQLNVKEIVNVLKRKFKLKEFGEFKWFFEMYIFKNKDKQLLQLLQQIYIEKLAIIYILEATGSNPDIPMFEKELFPVPSDIEISEKERRTYQKIVGSILFTIISSWLNIVFTAL